MFFLTEQNSILRLQKDFYFSGSVNLSIIEFDYKTTKMLCIYIYICFLNLGVIIFLVLCMNECVDMCCVCSVNYS